MALAVDARNMPQVITTRQVRIVGRRPNRSAAPPSSTEPSAMPTSSAERMTPSAARSTPHSAAIPGDAKLIASTSKPSSAFKPMHKATATICSLPIGEFSRISRGSSFMRLLSPCAIIATSIRQRSGIQVIPAACSPRSYGRFSISRVMQRCMSLNCEFNLSGRARPDLCAVIVAVKRGYLVQRVSRPEVISP